MRNLLPIALIMVLISCKSNDAFVNYQKVEIAGDIVETLEDHAVTFTPPTSSKNALIEYRLAYQVTQSPTHGTLENCFVNKSKECTFIPDPNYFGMDSIIYQALDSSIVSDKMEIKFKVNPVNDLPVAAEDFNLIRTASRFNFQLNVGSDIDSTELAYQIVSGPTNGILVGCLSVNDSSSINCTYSLKDGQRYGNDKFSYRVFDGEGYSENITTVGIQVVSELMGCLDQSAKNYADYYTIHDQAACIYDGCKDPTAANYKNDANIVHLQSMCQYKGCNNLKYSNASNYINLEQKGGGTIIEVQKCLFNGCTRSDSLETIYSLYGITSTMAVETSEYKITADETKCKYYVCNQSNLITNANQPYDANRALVSNPPSSFQKVSVSNVCEYKGCVNGAFKAGASNYVADLIAQGGGKLAVSEPCKIAGCTDARALNDLFSKFSVGEGVLTDNVNYVFTSNNKLCEYGTCSNAKASNYNLAYNDQDILVSAPPSGSTKTNRASLCEFVGCYDVRYKAGTNNIRASNFKAELNTSDLAAYKKLEYATCEIHGCTDVKATNDLFELTSSIISPGQMEVAGQYKILPDDANFTDQKTCRYRSCTVSGADNRNQLYDQQNNLLTPQPTYFGTRVNDTSLCEGCYNQNYPNATNYITAGNGAGTSRDKLCKLNVCTTSGAINFYSIDPAKLGVEYSLVDSNYQCQFYGCTDSISLNVGKYYRSDSKTEIGGSIPSGSSKVNKQEWCEYKGCGNSLFADADNYINLTAKGGGQITQVEKCQIKGCIDTRSNVTVFGKYAITPPSLETTDYIITSVPSSCEYFKCSSSSGLALNKLDLYDKDLVKYTPAPTVGTFTARQEVCEFRGCVNTNFSGASNFLSAAVKGTGKLTSPEDCQLTGCTDLNPLVVSTVYGQYNLTPGVMSVSGQYAITTNNGMCSYYACLDTKADNYQTGSQLVAKNSLCHYTGCTSDSSADNYINPQGKTADQIALVACVYNICEPQKTVTEQVKVKVNLDQVRSNIIFAVDTSGSMKDEIDQIRTNITKFVSDIKTLIPKTKIVVIGSEFTYADGQVLTLLPAPYEKNKTISSIYWHYNYIDSFNKLDSILNAFELPDYVNFLGAGQRLVSALPLITKLKEVQPATLDDETVAAIPVYIKDADFHFVIISDDNESQILDRSNASQVQMNYLMLDHFLQQMDSVLKINNNTFKIHAIYEKAGFNQSCQKTDADIFHHPYPLAVEKTQGGSFDICQTNWSNIFTKLTENVTGELTAVDLSKCQLKERSIVEVKATGGGKSTTILDTTDYTYFPAADGRPARVVIDPVKLKNKGFNILLEITFDIKYIMQ